MMTLLPSHRHLVCSFRKRDDMADDPPPLADVDGMEPRKQGDSNVSQSTPFVEDATKLHGPHTNDGRLHTDDFVSTHVMNMIGG